VKIGWHEERIIAIITALQSDLAVLQELCQLIEIEVGSHSNHSMAESAG
jgi:hypothetical protein